MRKLVCLLLLITSITLAQSPVPNGAKLEKIAGGFQQVEGPLWVDSLGLLFSDIKANKIYNWNEKDSISIFMNPSDSSNGLTLDKQGRLVLTQMEIRSVSRQEKDGTITVLASTFNGKRFSSPNDVVVKSDGAIFFTDPPFNIPIRQSREMSYLGGIYWISPSGSVQLIDSTLSYPNGICFSPDEKELYVNDSEVRIIYAWDVINDSTLTNKRKLASITTLGYADGMKVDSSGNIYCAGPGAVWIFAPDGTQLNKISVPDSLSNSPSNCNWGDADRKTLYITSNGTSSNVYRIRLAAVTGVKDNERSVNGLFQLYPNYPNPFNPSTVISWRLAKNAHVKLNIYDSLGSLVTTLVNEYQNAGKHSLTFDAKNSAGNKQLSSGVYFYELKIDDNNQVRKMMMLK